MGRLSNQEGANGWTDVYTIGYEDFSTANAGTLADNATKTFTYTVQAGDHVRNVAVYLETAFTDSGSGDELNVTVGDGVDPDGYITSASSPLHDAQTQITYIANTGALIDNENGKMYTAADTIDIVFTPNVSTGTDYSLNELTAGKVHFYFDIARLSDG